MKAAMAQLREWGVAIAAIAGTVLALSSTYTACQTSYVAERVENAERLAKLGAKDQIQDIEIAAAQAWQDAHERMAAPKIREHDLMAAQWPRAMRMLEAMHTFMVRRFQMPTSVEPEPDPFIGPVLSALPPPVRPPEPPAGSGVIAGEIHR